MKKPASKSKSGAKANPTDKKATAGQYKDRDLCGVNPLTEQFEPTDGSPVRQHFKMAGGA